MSELHPCPNCHHTTSESEKITFFDSVAIFQNYVPVPETSTKLSVNRIIEMCKDRIKNIQISNIPEPILANFEEIRKDAHTQFKEIMQGYWGDKLIEMTRYFYSEIDRLFALIFYETFSLKGSHKTSIELNSDIMIPRTQEEGDNFCDKELTIRLLKSEIIELALKWFLYVNDLANALDRCGEHTIKRYSKLEEFYDDLKKAWKKKYTKKIICQSTNNSNSPLEYLKRFFGFPTNSAKVEVTSLLHQINTKKLIGDLVYESIVMGYLASLESIDDLDIIIKLKGFMLLLTQSIDSTTRNINELIEASQRFNKDSLEKWGRDLNIVLDELIELEDRLFYFDDGYVKKYFSSKEVRKLSTKASSEEDLSKRNTSNTLKSLQIEF